MTYCACNKIVYNIASNLNTNDQIPLSSDWGDTIIMCPIQLNILQMSTMLLMSATKCYVPPQVVSHQMLLLCWRPNVKKEGRA